MKRANSTLLTQFVENKPLSEVSTLGIGGPAKYYVEVRSIEQMQEVLAACTEQNLRYFILGKGSNCLFDSKGLNRLVIHNKIEFCEETEPGRFYVGAGYSFSLLGTQVAKKGCGGLEFASGIPASCGGAVFMNAGAQGMQTWTNLEFVDYVEPTGRLLRLHKDELSYGYRFSAFQKMPGAIVACSFILEMMPAARETQLKLLDARIKTQPYGSKSAGCIFKNPHDTPAGLLIDKCGLKGYRVGGAKVSELHANFLINHDKASSNDLLDLIGHVRRVVKEKMGYDLESEVFWISDDETL
jgi:UDP-N-acetylmuramate dehydrogenase